jgi:hypothetical protein
MAIVTVEQVKRILPDYEKAFSHARTKLSQNIRGFSSPGDR